MAILFALFLPYLTLLVSVNAIKYTSGTDNLNIIPQSNSIEDRDQFHFQQMFMFPFNWHYLQKFNGTFLMKLQNCCEEDKQKHVCLKSPLPVCPIQNRQCSAVKAKTSSTNSESSIRGCCCDLKVNTHDAEEDNTLLLQLSQINVREVRMNKYCVCILAREVPRGLFKKIEEAPGNDYEKVLNGKINPTVPTSQNYIQEKQRSNDGILDQMTRYQRRKRSTLSNPMIYPTFRHINERKRARFSDSNFEMKMETGAGNGTWSGHLNSGHSFDDFRQRYKREIQVFMTRYRYTEKKTTTTTKPPSIPLRMTEKDLEFVYAKKKKSGPRIEAIVDGSTSHVKIDFD